MDTLIHKVKSEFTIDSVIEVYVLDENGDPFEVYDGSVGSLKPSLMEQVLNLSGCLYVFSIIGVDKRHVQSLSTNPENIVKREYSWLTDPEAPNILHRKERAISLEWKPIRFCGVEADVKNMQYVLEVAEGHEWRGGIVSKYVSDIPANDYRVMCRGSHLLQAEVEDLKPATWYHWRVCIEYNGIRAVSESRHAATLTAPPSPPQKPRIQVNSIPRSALGVSSPKIKLTWSPPSANGSGIEKYHVQLQEVAKGRSKETLGNGSDDNDKGAVLSKKWQTVYCNLFNECILSSPQAGRQEWRFRLRAKNADGWSAFGPTLVISKLTHPLLFQSTSFSTSLPETTASCGRLHSGMAEMRPTSAGHRKSLSVVRESATKLPVEELAPINSKPKASQDSSKGQQNVKVKRGSQRLSIESSELLLDGDTIEYVPVSESIPVEDSAMSGDFALGDVRVQTPRDEEGFVDDSQRAFIEKEIERLSTATHANKDYLRKLLTPMLISMSSVNQS